MVSNALNKKEIITHDFVGDADNFCQASTTQDEHSGFNIVTE